MSYQKNFSARHHTLTLPHLHTLTPILADVAQLVERNLAKVEVAGSNLVIRSKRKLKTWVFGFLFLFCIFRNESTKNYVMTATPKPGN